LCGTLGLWQDGQWYDLTTLIPTNSGWTFLGPRDINRTGQIVGWGTYNGSTHAFLLTPMSVTSVRLEQEEIALFGFGILFLDES